MFSDSYSPRGGMSPAGFSPGYASPRDAAASPAYAMSPAYGAGIGYSPTRSIFVSICKLLVFRIGVTCK